MEVVVDVAIGGSREGKTSGMNRRRREKSPRRIQWAGNVSGGRGADDRGGGRAVAVAFALSVLGTGRTTLPFVLVPPPPR
jgi:hypothetical protein